MEKVINRISEFCYGLDLGKPFGSINNTLFIFLILVLAFLSFDLDANEEQYMLFAKHFMDPDWITSRYLNEFPGTRLLYQTIIGFALKFFSFETVVFFSRLLLCALYAFPLAKIYKALDAKYWHILLHLPILYLFNQSMFAGSWMFVSVEPKGMAYIFILYAIYYFIKGNFKCMLVFLIFGTYCHILVGGYAFMFLLAALFIFEKPKQKFGFIKLGVIYVLALIPFVLYLKTAVITKVDYTPSVNWIYTYFRSPHHVGLFRDMSYFYSKHFYGVLTAVIALYFSLYYYKVENNVKLKRLNNFVLLSLIGALIFVVISFFDKEGVILKYYPFRVNVLTTFVITLIISMFIFSSLKSEFLRIFKQMTTLIALVILLKMTITTSFGLYKSLKTNNTKALTEIAEYIKHNTNKEDVVMSFLDDLSLSRRMERDRFVVYKFIPAEMNAIPEWYERELFKRKLAEDFNFIINKPNNYRIDYFLTRTQTNSDLIELIKSNSQYFLYKINIE